MEIYKMISRTLLYAGMTVIAAACSQVSFSPNPTTNGAQAVSGTPPGGTPPGGTPPGSSCSGNLGTTVELTKMLFVIDMSGSNQSAAGCAISATCTDPGKKMRGGSIQTFFNQYGPKTNFQWGFDVFQGTTATGLINNGASFGNAAEMQSAINTFMGMTDQDNTPYMAALTMAEQAIANDPDLNGPNNPQYLVVFMSDGQPDGTNDTTANILSEIDQIIALAPSKITFNGVYYGQGDPVAAGLIQSMATEGHGNFLNTYANPNGLDFQINDIIKVPCP